MTRSKTYGRTTRRYRQLRKQFRQQSETSNAPCWLCSQPIDYRIEWPDEEAFELDHLYPVSNHPEHAEDPAGFRASHRKCNQVRGNEMHRPQLTRTSRRWTKE